MLFVFGVILSLNTNCKQFGKDNEKDGKIGLGLLFLLSQQNQPSDFLIEIPAGLAK